MKNQLSRFGLAAFLSAALLLPLCLTSATEALAQGAALARKSLG